MKTIFSSKSSKNFLPRIQLHISIAEVSKTQVKNLEQKPRIN